ncbi:GTPase-activating Rap/Ran-GAP domain-like protein 3 [Balamuthia mandrillaris]
MNDHVSPRSFLALGEAEIAAYTGFELGSEEMNWLSKPLGKRYWKTDWEEDLSYPSLVKDEPGYVRELGSKNPTFKDPNYKKDMLYGLMEADKYKRYYRDYFYEREHDNYACTMDELNKEGPIIISVDSAPQNAKHHKVLVQTKKGCERVTITAKSISDHGSKIKAIKQTQPQLQLENIKFFKAKHPKMRELLLKYEESTISTCYKFGVIYCKEGQTTEDEMYNNEHGSPAFETFLNFLGNRVVLEGFTGFRGGLDIKTNTTGTHSVHTTFHEGNEIMFHVSTLLAYSPGDPQQVERKRHLGNDLVIIVFQEGPNEPFSPSSFRSQFNHVFLVVTPVPSIDGKFGALSFQVNIICKEGVYPFGPHLPYPPVFSTADPNAREWFITKLINAERAAFWAPDFVIKLRNTRKLQLSAIIEECSESVSQSRVLPSLKKGVSFIDMSKKKKVKKGSLGSKSFSGPIPSDSTPLEEDPFSSPSVSISSSSSIYQALSSSTPIPTSASLTNNQALDGGSDSNSDSVPRLQRRRSGELKEANNSPMFAQIKADLQAQLDLRRDRASTTISSTPTFNNSPILSRRSHTVSSCSPASFDLARCNPPTSPAFTPLSPSTPSAATYISAPPPQRPVPVAPIQRPSNGGSVIPLPSSSVPSPSPTFSASTFSAYRPRSSPSPPPVQPPPPAYQRRATAANIYHPSASAFNSVSSSLSSSYSSSSAPASAVSSTSTSPSFPSPRTVTFSPIQEEDTTYAPNFTSSQHQHQHQPPPLASPPPNRPLPPIGVATQRPRSGSGILKHNKGTILPPHTLARVPSPVTYKHDMMNGDDACADGTGDSVQDDVPPPLPARDPCPTAPLSSSS